MENHFPELSAKCINCNGIFTTGQLNMMSCCSGCSDLFLDETFGTSETSFPNIGNDDNQPFKPIYPLLGDGMDSMQYSTAGVDQNQQIIGSYQAPPAPPDTTFQYQYPPRADSVIQSDQDFTNAGVHTQDYNNNGAIQSQQSELELPSSYMNPVDLAMSNDIYADMLVNEPSPDAQPWDFTADQPLSLSEDTGVQSEETFTTIPDAAVAEESAASPLSALFPESTYASGPSPQVDSPPAAAPAVSSPEKADAFSDLVALIRGSTTGGVQPAPPEVQEEAANPLAGYHLLSSEESAGETAAGASTMPTTERSLEEVEADLFKTLSGRFGPQAEVQTAPAPVSDPIIIEDDYSSPMETEPTSTFTSSPPQTTQSTNPPPQTALPAFTFTPTSITTPKTPAETLCLPFLNSQGTWCPNGPSCPYHHFAHVLTPNGPLTAPPGSLIVATRSGNIVLSADYVAETQKAFEVHRREVKARKTGKFECKCCRMVKPKNDGNDGVRCTPCFKRKAACEALGQVWVDKVPRKGKGKKAQEGLGMQ